MTESFKRKAGEYVLESFKIYKLGETPTPQNSKNIWRLIHTWSFSESMSTGYIQGSAKVFDSDRVLDEFIGEKNGWLKGEEEIEIKITDFFQNSITLKFFLYAISNVKIASGNKDNVYEYEIFFVSKEKFYGDRLSIRRSFSGAPISEFANTVFNEYFESDKKIFVQETDGDQTLVVPNYTAEETMHFFTRKAISGDELYASQTYRFFESKDGFYFGTMGWIVDDYELFSGELDREGGVPIFVRSEFADQSPDGQLRMMSTLIDIEYPNYVNTIQDMSSGAYYKLTTELDFLNRTPLYTEYRHLDEYQNYRYPGLPQTTRSKHTKAFVDEHMNDALETLVFKDYKNPEQTFFDPNYLRPSTFYPKAYNQKNVNLYHHQNEMVKITIYGRNEITVGDIIELKLYDINYQTEDREIDIERSGRYIIESVVNIFSGDQFTQELMISRSGIYGQPERADDYENGPQTDSVYTESGQTPGARNVRGPGQAGSQYVTKQTNFVANNTEGKAAAEEYLGRPMSNEEYNALVAATFAESGRNQTEQAWISGTILNRARKTGQSVNQILEAPTQFTAVTGTSVDPTPSGNYIDGPPVQIENSINGSMTNILQDVPKDNYYFNAASPDAVQAGERYVTERSGVQGQLVGESFVFPGARWP